MWFSCGEWLIFHDVCPFGALHVLRFDDGAERYNLETLFACVVNESLHQQTPNASFAERPR